MKKINNKIVQIKNKSRELEQELKNKILSYVVASFGLVAGLAWNEAIKAMIEAVFPMQNDTLKAKFAYAIMITVALVLISFYLTRIFKKEEAVEAKDNKKIAKA